MLRKKLVSLFIISSFFSVNFINQSASAKVQPSNFFQYIGNNNQTESTEAELPTISMNDPRIDVLLAKREEIVRNAQAKYPDQDVSKIPEVQQQIVSVNQELRTIGVTTTASLEDIIKDVIEPGYIQKKIEATRNTLWDKQEQLVHDWQKANPGGDPLKDPKLRAQIRGLSRELTATGLGSSDPKYEEENLNNRIKEIQANLSSGESNESKEQRLQEETRMADKANEFSNKSKREAVENFMKNNPGKNPEDDPELQQKIIKINREYNRMIGRSDDDPSAVPPDDKSAVRMSILIEVSEINGINPVTGKPLEPLEPLTQSELVLAGDKAAQQIAKDEGEKFSTEWGQKNPGLLANKDGTGIEQSTLDARQKAITDKTTQQSVEDARGIKEKLLRDEINNQGSGIEASGLGLNSATQLKDKLTEQSVQAARQRRIDLGMEAETDPNISVNKPVIPMTDKGGSLGVQLKEGQAQRETALSEAKGKINKPTVPDSQAVKDAKTIADAKALSNKTNVNRSVYLPNSSEEKELQAALARTGKEYPTVRDDYAHQSDAPAKASKDDSRKTEFDGDSDKPATVSLNKKDKKQGERIELAKDVDGFYGEEGAGGSFAADKFTKDQKYSLGKAGTKDTKFPTSLPSGTFEEAQALADQLGANIPTTGNIVIPNPLTGALVSVPAEMATCLFSGGANCVGDAVKGLVKDYAGKIFGQVFGTGMLGQVANGAVGGAVDGAFNGDILGGVQNGAMGGLTGSLQDQVGGALNGLTANAEVLSVAQQASTAAFGCMTQGQCNPTDMVKNAAGGVVTNAVNSGVSGLANTGRQVVGSENIGTVRGTPDQVLAWANGGERPKGSTKGMTGTAIR